MSKREQVGLVLKEGNRYQKVLCGRGILNSDRLCCLELSLFHRLCRVTFFFFFFFFFVPHSTPSLLLVTIATSIFNRVVYRHSRQGKAAAIRVSQSVVYSMEESAPLGTTDSGESSQTIPPSSNVGGPKRNKISRACDECRKRKVI